MIIDLFLTIIYIFIYGLTAIFRVFDDVDLTGQFGQATEKAGMYLATLDFIFPVDTAINILSVLVAFILSYFSLKGINWIIRKIPTIS